MLTSKWIAAVGVAAIAITSTQLAAAQEKAEGPSYLATRVDAPSQAFELAVAGTYTQGLTSPATGTGATDLTKAGGAVRVRGTTGPLRSTRHP